MALSDNLLYLRKKFSLTQEDLAEQLGVTRQTVSKWESGQCYPEMDKILFLCDTYGCSLEQIMRGSLAADPSPSAESSLSAELPPSAVPSPSAAAEPAAAPPFAAAPPEKRPADPREREEYERENRRFALFVGCGLFLLFAGVSFLVLTYAVLPESTADIAGITVLLSALAAAIFLFAFGGIRHDGFLKNFPARVEYTPEERAAETRRFSLFIASGLAELLLGVILLVAFSGRGERMVTAMTALMLALLAVALFSFSYAGIRNSRMEEPKDPAGRNWTDRACGAIMLLATAVFLLLGFLWGLWHPGWVVFPIGGILCAIVSTLFEKK